MRSQTKILCIYAYRPKMLESHFYQNTLLKSKHKQLTSKTTLGNIDYQSYTTSCNFDTYFWEADLSVLVMLSKATVKLRMLDFIRYFKSSIP